MGGENDDPRREIISGGRRVKMSGGSHQKREGWQLCLLFFNSYYDFFGSTLLLLGDRQVCMHKGLFKDLGSESPYR